MDFEAVRLEKREVGGVSVRFRVAVAVVASEPETVESRVVGRRELKRALRVGLVFVEEAAPAGSGAELCEEASGPSLVRLDHGEVLLLLAPSSAALKLFREAENLKCFVGEGGPVAFLVSL